MIVLLREEIIEIKIFLGSLKSKRVIHYLDFDYCKYDVLHQCRAQASIWVKLRWAWPNFKVVTIFSLCQVS